MEPQEITWVEHKLQELVDIIPDLSGRVDKIKATIIMELITDTQASQHSACKTKQSKLA